MCQFGLADTLLADCCLRRRLRPERWWYKRAFPRVTAEYLKYIGTHSGRKTLAQALWDSGFSRRLIADAGGWFLKKEAMDLYFRTARLTILRALSSLSLTAPVHQPFVVVGD